MSDQAGSDALNIVVVDVKNFDDLGSEMLTRTLITKLDSLGDFLSAASRPLMSALTLVNGILCTLVCFM